MTQDEQHINLLGLFHYILGGITIFFSCIFLLYVGIGIAAITGHLDGADAPPEWFGWFFIIFGGIAILMGWTLGILMIVAGRKLQAHTSRIFCLVIAGLECLNMPLGTILGVFTIVVLTKPSVIALFEGRPAALETT